MKKFEKEGQALLVTQIKDLGYHIGFCDVIFEDTAQLLRCTNHYKTNTYITGNAIWRVKKLHSPISSTQPK